MSVHGSRLCCICHVCLHSYGNAAAVWDIFSPSHAPPLRLYLASHLTEFSHRGEPLSTELVGGSILGKGSGTGLWCGAAGHRLQEHREGAEGGAQERGLSSAPAWPRCTE